ncbi:uncharacterized protein BDZ99DRAFT_112585 [Mytilinidion resinicola]|uniref:Uncharacterized protein n=1 Tax=Mytilinidion resinicola TaxID=574789 RepID=A0A6A6Y8D3_9PEZI|nr:uncharacterized protein BDZ99DRAFT_112585 [Mytilinidion resinicola]KAF2805072.1 hypothetical protein BDZ99DRAFT_112585 [Mytilinidion resinicola]
MRTHTRVWVNWRERGWYTRDCQKKNLLKEQKTTLFRGCRNSDGLLRDNGRSARLFSRIYRHLSARLFSRIYGNLSARLCSRVYRKAIMSARAGVELTTLAGLVGGAEPTEPRPAVRISWGTAELNQTYRLTQAVKPQSFTLWRHRCLGGLPQRCCHNIPLEVDCPLKDVTDNEQSTESNPTELTVSRSVCVLITCLLQCT